MTWTLGTNNLENSIGMRGVLQQDALIGDNKVRVTAAGFGKQNSGGDTVIAQMLQQADGELVSKHEKYYIEYHMNIHL